ncbi:glycosyltransferase [Streptomyces sp. NPDC001093]|uniref:glycosyltransferase n=1 Tax=Streptomyces sp. NPDC001093 TaxID=3154376 RepID=UPI003329BB55
MRPDAVLLLGGILHFRSQLPALQDCPAPVAGWFPVEFDRDTPPHPWRAVLGCCARILAQAENGRSQMARATSRNDIGLVGLGVDLDIFHPVDPPRRRQLRTRLGWDPDAFVFLYVGRNDPRKGIEYAIEALRLYCRDDPQAARRTVLHLHTQPGRGLLELIHASDLAAKVTFSRRERHLLRDPFSETDVAALYQAADALLFPSTGEGFGMPLLEAQAAGLPVVATANSAIGEVVGRAGLLIHSPGRVTALDDDCIVWAWPPDPVHAATLMNALFHNPDLHASLSTHGLRQSATRSWDTIADELLDELHAVTAVPAVPTGTPR